MFSHQKTWTRNMAVKNFQKCLLNKNHTKTEAEKMEKTFFERYQNNTAIGMDYLTLKKCIQFFISKPPASFLKNVFFRGLGSYHPPPP